jgi:heat shock protein HslJ
LASPADIKGEWTITAVNGARTGGGEAFTLLIHPPEGGAQFGCNAGGGAARVEAGRLITRDWIITAAGCRSERIARFERAGFDILSEPTAVQPKAGGLVQLRNRRGSIELKPLAPRALAGTSWRVVQVNEVAPPDPGQSAVRFGRGEFEAMFGCNSMRGGYRQEGAVLRTLSAAVTERGCELVGHNGVPVLTYEQWGFKILSSGPRVMRVRSDAIRLISPQGSMVLETSG